MAAHTDALMPTADEVLRQRPSLAALAAIELLDDPEITPPVKRQAVIMLGQASTRIQPRLDALDQATELYSDALDRRDADRMERALADLKGLQGPLEAYADAEGRRMREEEERQEAQERRRQEDREAEQYRRRVDAMGTDDLVVFASAVAAVADALKATREAAETTASASVTSLLQAAREAASARGIDMAALQDTRRFSFSATPPQDPASVDGEARKPVPQKPVRKPSDRGMEH